MHSDEHTIVAVATDDIVITSKHLADIMRFKSDLSGHWDLNDLGEINWYLGFEVKCNRAAHTISINQQVYIESMADKFRLTNAKPVGTPMEPRSMFSKEQDPMSITKAMHMRGVPYIKAIRSILWPACLCNLSRTLEMSTGKP